MGTAEVSIHIPFCTLKCIKSEFYSIEHREMNLTRVINLRTEYISAYKLDFERKTKLFSLVSKSMLPVPHYDLDANFLKWLMTT